MSHHPVSSITSLSYTLHCVAKLLKFNGTRCALVYGEVIDMKLSVASRVDSSDVMVEADTVPDLDCYSEPDSEPTIKIHRDSSLWQSAMAYAAKEFSQ